MIKTIDWQIDENKIGYLFINSPPANEMTSQFFKELVYLTKEVIREEEIRAIIISGKGRHFSSGANLDQLIGKIRDHLLLDKNGEVIEYPSFLTEEHKAFAFFSCLKIPVIAAITGVCIGSGFELALCARKRICGEGAVLGLPETTFGLMPGCGGIFLLPGLVGPGKALELILSGETFVADEGLKWGIVDKVLAKKEVIPYCVELALDISRKNKR